MGNLRLTTDTAVALNDVLAVYRSHCAAFVVGAFPTGRVALALYHRDEPASPCYRDWLKAKQESKARWFGYAY